MQEPAQAFEPPAPIPRTTIPSYLEVIRAVVRNPLELWGEPSYTLPWIHTRFLNESALIANDPAVIKHVLVTNASNFRLGTIRQLILRPILEDGLLTAEDPIWRRSRKAMAPVFTPRHAAGFARQMQKVAEDFNANYATECERDIAQDMTELTYQILAETLFSANMASGEATFAEDTEKLLHTMGRVDPLDLLKAPGWIPRVMRLRGRKVLRKFRSIVAETMEVRRKQLREDPESVPEDFLTLLMRQERPDGLTRSEIEDNLITFIGAGHETTARALAWTLYCLANAPEERKEVEGEIDAVVGTESDPVKWLERMPKTRAAFEEAMRLYPPAPTISRTANTDDRCIDSQGKPVDIPKDTTVLVMPWTLHRHEALWSEPRCFKPQRFWPENRSQIDRFQYLPFGAGPRVCIGATFALQEAVIALGILMSASRFDVTAQTNPWPVQKLTTQPEGGLPMKITPRRVASQAA